jgi:uncharacterized Tic20 family protein
MRSTTHPRNYTLMNEFENVTAPPPPPAGVAPQEDRVVALIVHLTGIVVSFVVPLILWLVNKDNPAKAWLNDQSKEALNFQITVFLAYVVCSVLGVIGIGFLLMPLVWIANLVLCILAGIKANEGVTYRYPFALRLIK